MSRVTNTPSAPLAIRSWVLACALLSAMGWLLSAVGQLNRAGYGLALACGAAVLVLALRPMGLRKPRFQQLSRRFRRPFPLAFLALALLALLGGCLYPPSNYDALAYRTARVLRWLDAGHWHWISTAIQGSLNNRTCAFEWMTAPVLLFFHSDRALFLFNVISFLLLPGLVFSVWRRLGLSSRVAWHWMWLLPAGLCFVLQAGSLANDLFGAALALAAIDFALRARESRPMANLRYSLLCAALMTGAKVSNLTLLLPWAIAVAPALREFCLPGATARRSEAAAPSIAPEPDPEQPSKERPRRVPAALALNVATLCLALLASFVPIAWLNYRYTGDWTGMASERTWLRPPGKMVSLVHNAALLTVQHLAPPVFPFASSWNHFVQSHLSEHWKATLKSFAEYGGDSYHLQELPGEEYAGLGLGLILLVGAQVLVGVVCARREVSFPDPPVLQNSSTVRLQGAFSWPVLWRFALLVSPYISMAVFMCNSGLVAVSRVLAPDYALLLPLPLVLSYKQRYLRTRWWRILAGVAVAFAFIAVVLTPARPLFPAASMLGWLERHHPSPIVSRADTVYSVYRQRWNAFASLLECVPPGVKVLGAATGWAPETCLWRPLGHRRVVDVRGDLSLEMAGQVGLEYVVVEMNNAEGILGCPFPEWLRRMHGLEVLRKPILLMASRTPREFALVRVGHDTAPGPPVKSPAQAALARPSNQ
jgi:hypothetical protein